MGIIPARVGKTAVPDFDEVRLPTIGGVFISSEVYSRRMCSMYNPQLRVKGEVEALVEEVSRRLGYDAFTVRNVSILYGLPFILALGRVPKSDREFLVILGRVSSLVGKPVPVDWESVGEGRYVKRVRKRRKKSKGESG